MEWQEISADNEKIFTILDLNPDCLREIFKYLTFIDLMALFKVNSHFYDAIGMALASGVYVRLSYKVIEENKMETIEKFFELFGEKLNSVIFCEGESLLMEMIQKYSISGTVKKCKYFGEKITEIFEGKNQNFFKSVKELYWEDVILNQKTIKLLLKAPFEIEKLSLIDMDGPIMGDADLIRHILCSQLKKLHFATDCYFDTEEIKDLSYNTTLTDLTLSATNTAGGLILRHLSQIERLKLTNLNNIQTYSEEILSLNNLKQLDFSFCFNMSTTADFESFFCKLAELNKLEKLRITLYHFGISEQMVLHLCNMTNLKSLDIQMDYKSLQPHLFKFAYYLKKLREFGIYFPRNVSHFEIESTLCALVSATNFTILRCYFYNQFSWDDLAEKFAIIRENQNNENILLVQINLDQMKWKSGVTVFKNKWVEACKYYW